MFSERISGDADRLAVMHMRWNDLAFFHWPVDAAAIRSRLPNELQLDLFEGQAWLGVTPFYMTGVRPSLMPPLPGLSAFAELNLRTYVIANGRPGVWFFSLDATSRLAVRTARLALGLPYFDADIEQRIEPGEVHYRSVRTHCGAPAAAFEASYRPIGETYRSQAGALDHWLTERYSLFTVRRATLLRLDIQHDPWPLQPAAATIKTNTLISAVGLPSPNGDPLVHFAKRLDVGGGLPRRLAKAQPCNSQALRQNTEQALTPGT